MKNFRDKLAVVYRRRHGHGARAAAPSRTLRMSRSGRFAARLRFGVKKPGSFARREVKSRRDNSVAIGNVGREASAAAQTMIGLGG
jgi:hypothetical protein